MTESRRNAITVDHLLQAYASGLFPMSESADDPEIFWVEPRQRGIFELDRFHVSRSLRRRMRKADYTVTIDTCFPDVVRACADRQETWINDTIFALYMDLHRLGYAHSVEVHQNAQLIGGVYGVALGSAFFGESMFSRATDGSKLALANLVARLRFGGFTLFDTQFLTDHLASLGAIEIPQAEYLNRLHQAIIKQANFELLNEHTSQEELVHLITQTS